jgi:hypothetical protein
MKLRIELEIDDSGTPQRTVLQVVSALGGYVQGLTILSFVPSNAPLFSADFARMVGRAYVDVDDGAVAPVVSEGRG